MANYWESDIQLPNQQADENNTVNPKPLYGASEPGKQAEPNRQSPYAGSSPYASQPLYGGGYSPTNPPEKPRRERKGGGFGVGLVAICAVLSLLCGFLGTVAGNRWFPPKEAPGAGSSIVQAPSHELSSGSESDSSLSAVVAATKDSVVEITTESVTTSSIFGQYVTQGAGSGVIIRTDGYIVTNNHVASDASTINVTLSNGEKHVATLVGRDSKTDLAVIKIDASGLTPAVFGNTSDIKVGDAVIAIGNPLGSLGGTVTNGIISALDREILVQGQSMRLLQTSAAINPGNSGGGLFNVYGELVGIVNAKPNNSALSGNDTSIDGLGFAIPVDTVKEVASQIIDNGYVTGRAVLGLSVLEINDPQTAQQYGVDRYGVYIVSITPNLGADKAGLKVGDCIVSVEDIVVSQTSDVTKLLDSYSVGDTVNVQLIREGKMISSKVVLSENVPTEQPPQQAAG
ncbi:MAG: trypsin-like peptidase domain-containing protein [Oscillospiraceae bacterium]